METSTNANGEAPLPVVRLHNGELTADSRDVAAYFGREHRHVLTAIRELHCSSDFRAANFRLFKINDLTGETTSHVEMTKDGFTFAVLGFTGKKAALFKEGYITQFNAMDAELRRLHELGATAALEAKVDRMEAALTAMIVTHDNRRAAVTHVSVKALLDEAGALSKGRNSVNRKIGRQLKDRALFVTSQGEAAPHLKDANLGVWIFDRHFADRYMRDKGLELVALHNDKVAGQSVIRFPDRRKSTADKPAQPSA